jgi:hypothetical protein
MKLNPAAHPDAEKLSAILGGTIDDATVGGITPAQQALIASGNKATCDVTLKAWGDWVDGLSIVTPVVGALTIKKTAAGTIDVSGAATIAEAADIVGAYVENAAGSLIDYVGTVGQVMSFRGKAYGSALNTQAVGGSLVTAGAYFTDGASPLSSVGNTVALSNISFDNTTRCTFVGFESGKLSTGVDCTSLGFEALGANTTGGNNTAVGKQALRYNVGGAANTAVGFQALRGGSAGTYNTALGCDCMQVNNGYNNTGLGADALLQEASGYENTSVGCNSLFNSNGANRNTACGTRSLYAVTTGSFNTACGYNSGVTITTGTYCTFLGHGADAGAVDLTYATAIGAGSVVDASNRIMLGRVADSVKIPSLAGTGSRTVVVDADGVLSAP